MNTTPVSQYAWHLNPNTNNEPCKFCGCAGKVSGPHRALRADERTRGATYVKSASSTQGFDGEWTYLNRDGNAVK